MSNNCKDERLKPPAPKAAPLDLAAVREKLSQAKGKRYWRSLEELAETEEFKEMLHREFPRHASEWSDGVSRRNFMQLMGASLALAGLSACTKQPVENIVPYVRQPEEIIPGKPLYFATSMPLGAVTRPVLVKSDMGRPIKVDGNPDHPAGSSGSDVYTQASILGLYDPDRSQTIVELGEVRTWGDFLTSLQAPLNAQKASKGAGLRFLTGDFTSPTLASQMKAVLKTFPQAKWHVWEPVNHDNGRAGAQLAFGQTLRPQYKLENADVVLSLDADFLSPANNSGFLHYAAAFGKRRKVEAGNLNRLYVVESILSPTGAKADHRLPVKATQIESFARVIAGKLGVGGGATAESGNPKFVDAVVADLQKNRGKSLVMAGETQPPAVHALVHAINDALGNAGKTVTYFDPVTVLPDGFTSHIESLRDLARDIEAKKVELLVIIDSNPAYTAPADLKFAHLHMDDNSPAEWKQESILLKVPNCVHIGLYQDETAQFCRWHINAAHYLESWSDARTPDGTFGIIQPLIDPLYGGKTAHEVLGAFTETPGSSSYDWVRGYWKSQHNPADFEAWWRKALHNGYVDGPALPEKKVSARAAGIPAPTKAAEGLELVLRPDPHVYDGRFANNGWLQELPKPITLFTWDNAALFSFNTAKKFGITSDHVIELEVGGRKLRTVAWLIPGMPDDCINLHLGYGRTWAGHNGNGHGYNAYLLSTTGSPLVITGVSAPVLTDEMHQVAAVHVHHNVEFEPKGEEWKNRGIVRTATLEEYKANPQFAHEGEYKPQELTMYKPQEHRYDPQTTPYKWGMSIDLNSCIGCSSCVVACQSENNIPVVGQFEVTRGREMHWIRIDNYFQGDLDNPKTHFQPVTCMQCENAPCEVVCPVGATVHSTEGLNDMVYNRCVGTRYCSNNCPYKVRRFNFMLYSDFETPQFKLLNNPDVTVRSRGVMEKCTYCIQRINRGRIEAEKASRQIADGEVKTACQQSCPADAIVFGNLNDQQSRVYRLQNLPHNYGMLAEDLNTHPRTMYLAEITNPNRDLMEESEKQAEHS
ncbi:MAG TPA: TAT-variant-translocated molybdopterin oxidoreductase [Terriglobales bacterium]|jgi:MoCo/4Fe-4S cofactor protein with predicted Tat translocation signal|nr:TAT-variant-translocated molybdopterin oxidoreductase [Terriglobales bacterium]